MQRVIIISAAVTVWFTLVPQPQPYTWAGWLTYDIGGVIFTCAITSALRALRR